jgi:hypothetical protein
MYMAPIVQQRRPASSPALRLAVGMLGLAFSALVMLPWLAVNGAVSALVIAALALARGPRALVQAVSYAGQVTLGR